MMTPGFAKGLQLGGAGLGFGGDMMSAAGEYLKGRANKIAHEQNMRSLQMQAGDYSKAAGVEQKRGRQAVEHRYLQLGDDIGQIYAGAAGSGIDAGSDIVQRIVAENRREARIDTQVIADNAKEASNAATQRALMARINAVNERASAKIAGDAAKMAMFGGVVSAFGRLAGAVGGAYA